MRWDDLISGVFAFLLFGAVIAIAVGEIEAYSKCNSNGGVYKRSMCFSQGVLK